jgi:hypothetical protein
MSIKNRNFKGGEKLTRTWHGKTYTVDVRKTKDGIKFVYGGEEFKSISGPSCKITGSRGSTGWQWFNRADEVAAKKSPAKKSPVKKSPTKINAVIASDAEMAAEVKLAGGAKKVARAVVAGTTKRSHKKASTKEVA